jgi:sRNA-binding protein
MPDSTDLPVPPPIADEALPEAPAQPTATAAPAAPSADAAPDQAGAAEDAGPTSLADDTAADDTAADDSDTDAPAPAAASGPGTPALPLLTPAAAADLLRQHFPALFAGPAKPFKLRIQQDIQARAPGVFSKATLSAYFRRHTGSTAYLIGLTKATHRFDLDGQPAGELTEEHKQLAQAELTRRRQITREREQQAQAQQRAQQRETQRTEMAQQAEQMQARQARAALLRDFQRTTLTLANFCALKGMTPEVLNPLLEQARKEAAEAPPVPARAFDDRHPRRDEARPGGRPDHRGPRRDDRRPARPGGAPAPRGPRGPAGQS